MEGGAERERWGLDWKVQKVKAMGYLCCGSESSFTIP